MNNTLKVVLRVVLVLGFLFFLKKNFHLDDINKIEWGFEPFYFILFMLVSPLMLIFRGFIWLSLLGLKAGENLWLFSKVFASMMANVVLPGRAGDIYKAWWSRSKTNEKYSHIFFLLVFEKIIEGSTVLFFLFLCFMLQIESLLLKYSGLITYTILILTLLSLGIKSKKLTKYCKGFGYGFLVRFFSFLSFYFFIKSLNIDLGAFDVFHINNIAALGAFVAILPAGLLTYQIAATYGFSICGLDESLGVVISGFYHALLIIITLLSGLISVVLFEKDYRYIIKILKIRSKIKITKEALEGNEWTGFADRCAAEEDPGGHQVPGKKGC